MTRGARQLAGAIVLVGSMIGLSGCEWWPPALQERIGQQDSQIKALQADKARMQAKVTELSKALEDTKAQVTHAEQVNGELKAQIDILRNSLADAEAKVAEAKAGKSKTTIAQKKKR